MNFIHPRFRKSTIITFQIHLLFLFIIQCIKSNSKSTDSAFEPRRSEASKFCSEIGKDAIASYNYEVSNSCDFHNMQSLKSKCEPLIEEEKKPGENSSYLLSTPPSLNLDISYDGSQYNNDDIIVSELILEDLQCENSEGNDRADKNYKSQQQTELIHTSDILKLFSKEEVVKEKCGKSICNSDNKIQILNEDKYKNYSKLNKMKCQDIFDCEDKVSQIPVLKYGRNNMPHQIDELHLHSNHNFAVEAHSHKHAQSEEHRRLINEKWINKNFNTISDNSNVMKKQKKSSLQAIYSSNMSSEKIRQLLQKCSPNSDSRSIDAFSDRTKEKYKIMNDIHDNINWRVTLRTDSSCSAINTFNPSRDNDSIENNTYTPENLFEDKKGLSNILSIVDEIFNYILHDAFPNENLLKGKLNLSLNSSQNSINVMNKPENILVSPREYQQKSIFDIRDDDQRQNDCFSPSYEDLSNTPYSHLNVEFKSNCDDQGSDSNNSDEMMKNFLMIKDYEMNRDRDLKSKCDSRFLYQFMECIFDKILTKFDLFLMAFCKPIRVDPLEELCKLRFEKTQNPLLDPRTSVLTQSLFNAIGKFLIINDTKCPTCVQQFQPDSNVDLNNQKRHCFCSQINNSDKLSIFKESKFSHFKAIFDCINEQINKLRPCGVKGQSMPWVKEKSLTTLYTKNITNIVDSIRVQMFELNEVKAGPQPCSDCYNNDDFSEEYFADIRERKLCNLLTFDIQSEEKQNWLDCEWEEVQVKLDLADIIFEYLVEETICVVNKIC